MSYVGERPYDASTKEERRKRESERPREERDQIKFIDLGFERWQVVRFRKAKGKTFHKLHVLWMNESLSG